jgi:hypothetical protein
VAKSLSFEALDAATEKLWDELTKQQEAKVLRLANEMRPNTTWDDLLQPQDLPEVANDPTFNFEDGLLAGIKAARMAFRARVLGPLREG